MHRHLGDAEIAQGLSQPSLAFGAMRLVVGGWKAARSGIRALESGDG